MEATERRKFFALWMRHFGWWLLLYLSAYAAAMWAILNLPQGTPRTVLVLAPILPGLMLIWSTVRAYRAGDEFVQREVLLAAALAALVTAVWTLIYAYLEPLGFPHLNMGLVHTIGWPVFLWRMIRLMRLQG